MIKCLFFDDEPKNAKLYQFHIRLQWKRLFGEDIEFTSERDASSAIQKLKVMAFDLVVADVMEKLPDEPGDSDRTTQHIPVGLDIIQEARSSSKKAVILGFSHGYAGEYDYPRLQREVIGAGADMFRLRSEIRERYDVLCHDLRGLLLQRSDVVHPAEVVYDKLDEQVDNVVTEIGKSTIVYLYTRLIENGARIKRIEISFVNEGMSGAIPLRVRSTDDMGLVADHLLKLSRTPQRLLDELKRYPTIGQYSSRTLVRYIGSGSVDVCFKGWYGIVAQFESASVSLSSWLTLNRDSVALEGVFRSLFFNGGLSSGYQVHGKGSGEDDLGVLEALLPKGLKRLRVLSAIKVLRSVITESGLADGETWTRHERLVKTLLGSGQLGAVDHRRLEVPALMVSCHGDLHGGNVLVSDHSPYVALVIDTADFGVAHWATDVSRLFVDLAMHACGSGWPEVDWSRVHAWRDGIVRLYKGEDDGLWASGPGSWLGAQWLVANVRAICPAIQSDDDWRLRNWELMLAVALQFLRCGYRQNLPWTKRCVGIAVGSKMLDVCASEFLTGYNRI